MTSCATTGLTVPAWIRERVGRYERAWPAALLAAGLAASLLAGAALLEVLWTADAVVYYALP